MQTTSIGLVGSAVVNSAVAVDALAQGDVKKDTITSTTVKGNQAVASLLEQLVVEREVWEQTLYRTSNDQLYGLIQRCYGLYKAM